MSTILIKNARMRGHQELTDLYIKDGVFAEIGGGLSYPADEIIDVAGKLVSAPFCDAHLHLDAVLSVGKPRYNMSGTLIEGINIWGERMQGLTKETIKKTPAMSSSGKSPMVPCSCAPMQMPPSRLVLWWKRCWRFVRK